MMGIWWSNQSNDSNLENGFDQHQKVQPSHRTLVQEMTWLDNNMENLLQAPPAPTIRFIPNTPKQQQSPSPAAETTIIEEAQPATPKYTIKQIEEAKDKREAEIRKLQAKFRNELSDVSKDLTSKILLIKLPLNAECHFKEQLEGFISIEMAIPAHYPLDPCRIKIANTGDLEPWRARYVITTSRYFLLDTSPVLSKEDPCHKIISLIHVPCLPLLSKLAGVLKKDSPATV